MPHIDPELNELLRFVWIVGGITITYFTIGKRVWRWFRKWWTRPLEPGQ